MNECNAWVIVTDVEYGRMDAFGYSYRFDVLNHEDKPSSGLLDKMEELRIKRPKLARYPFVITIGDKPAVRGLYRCKILRLDLSKATTLRHLAFLDVGAWNRYMTGESDCELRRIENPSDISRNHIVLSLEIAWDEILECIGA